MILRTTWKSRQQGINIYHEIQLGDIPNIGCNVDPSRDVPYFDVEFETTAKPLHFRDL